MNYLITFFVSIFIAMSAFAGELEFSNRSMLSANEQKQAEYFVNASCQGLVAKPTLRLYVVEDSRDVHFLEQVENIHFQVIVEAREETRNGMDQTIVLNFNFNGENNRYHLGSIHSTYGECN